MASRMSTRSSTSAEIILQEGNDSNSVNNDGNTNKVAIVANMANVATGANRHVDTIESSYELNKEKAMANKILSASRKEYEYDITGGGHRIRFNTGTYEYIKSSLPTFYENHSEFYGKERFHVEKSNSVVDVMITVHWKSNHTKCFVINLHNTTSLVMVNGKNPEIFKQHLEELMCKIKQGEVNNINTMLEGMRRSSRTKKPSPKLQEHLEQKNNPSSGVGGRKQNIKLETNGGKQSAHRAQSQSTRFALPSIPPSTCATPNDDTNPKTVKMTNAMQMQQKEMSNTQVKPKTNQNVAIDQSASQGNAITCPTCGRRAGTQVVKCDTCSLKIHYECEGLQPDEIKRIRESNYAYKCTSCSIITYDTEKDNTMPTNSGENEVHDVQTGAQQATDTLNASNHDVQTGAQQATDTPNASNHNHANDKPTSQNYQPAQKSQTIIDQAQPTVDDENQPTATEDSNGKLKSLVVQTQDISPDNSNTVVSEHPTHTTQNGGGQKRGPQKPTKTRKGAKPIESLENELIEQNTLLKNLNNKYVEKINTLTDQNRMLRLQLLACDNDEQFSNRRESNPSEYGQYRDRREPPRSNYNQYNDRQDSHRPDYDQHRYRRDSCCFENEHLIDRREPYSHESINIKMADIMHTSVTMMAITSQRMLEKMMEPRQSQSHKRYNSFKRHHYKKRQSYNRREYHHDENKHQDRHYREQEEYRQDEYQYRQSLPRQPYSTRQVYEYSDGYETYNEVIIEQADNQTLECKYSDVLLPQPRDISNTTTEKPMVKPVPAPRKSIQKKQQNQPPHQKLETESEAHLTDALKMDETVVVSTGTPEKKGDPCTPTYEKPIVKPVPAPRLNIQQNQQYQPLPPNCEMESETEALKTDKTVMVSTVTPENEGTIAEDEKVEDESEKSNASKQPFLEMGPCLQKPPDKTGAMSIQLSPLM